MRKRTEISRGWRFYSCDSAKGDPVFSMEGGVCVDLPHVWNKDDPSETGFTVYQRTFTRPKGNKVFIEFGAVAGVCQVWLNGELIGEHRGGYAKFRFELTEYLREGENFLSVAADNTRFEDVNPLTGDFNNYGGIYRPVYLIETEDTHFDLMYYGTEGLTIEAHKNGSVRLNTRVTGAAEGLQVEYTLLFGENSVVSTVCSAQAPAAELLVDSPHLWNGKTAPNLYRCIARLLDGDKCLDQIELPFGFREIVITADKGLFLNGERVTICGVAKHQDFEGMGCAPTEEQLHRDMELIHEIGANAVRLSHYQHPDLVYDLCDEMGFLVWAEVPVLSLPDGNSGVLENAKHQLTELILQCCHHPSIFCWGIQNEIAMLGESLEMYGKVEQLTELAKSLDPTRRTASANLYCVKNQSQLNFITDIVGYNIYYGWYYGELQDYGPFLDGFHGENPTVPLGVSEYGVDCSVGLHSIAPRRKDYSEDYQALFHETVYPQIRNRTFLWGSFVWNMFDFGSAIRNEGGVKGKNCKGLVTFDRRTKKDAFYYYKAWWSKEPFVYIAGRRFARRCGERTSIKVYTNQEKVTLLVNGEEYASKSERHVIEFEDVPLFPGANQITAVSEGISDTVTLTRVEEPERSYVFVDPNPELDVRNWFTMGQSADELFPEDRCSIMDSISTLKAIPEAWSLLQQETPQITENPRNKNGSPMTLLRVFQWMKGEFDEDFIRSLNEKLNKIKRPPAKEAGKKEEDAT